MKKIEIEIEEKDAAIIEAWLEWLDTGMTLAECVIDLVESYAQSTHNQGLKISPRYSAIVERRLHGL